MPRRTGVASILLWGLITSLAAAEAVGPDTPVVTVNDKVITLRQLEDAMLAKEGSDKLMEVVRKQLGKVPWSTLTDDQVLVSIGSWRIPRVLLVGEMLNEAGPAVRTDLVGQEITRQALAKHGIDVDAKLLDAELALQDRELARLCRDRKQPVRDLKTQIEAESGMTLEEYRRQESFRLAAGLHELVFRIAVIAPDAEAEENLLKAWYARDPEQYGVREAYRLAIIHRPYHLVTASGTKAATDQDKADARAAMQQLEKDVRTNPKFSFETAWKYWGAPFDPNAEAGGQIGWVGRDGKASVTGAQPVPVRLAESIFNAAKGLDLTKGPVLLAVLEHPDGLALVRVHEYRKAEVPELATVRIRVRRDFIESDLPKWTAQVQQRIRRETTVRFSEWDPIVRQRQKDAAPALKALSEPAKP